MKGRAERKKSAGVMNFSDRSALKYLDMANLQMVDIESASPMASLLDFIGSGEGDYNSSNSGTDSDGNIVHYSHNTVRDGKKLSEMTLDEIRTYQSIKDPNDKDRLFTVGKYQLVPDTFEQAVKGLGLDDDTTLTPEVQDQMGIYLVAKKPGRTRLSGYLSGDTSISIDRAMLDLAMEFASVPVPTAIKKGTYGNWPKRDILAGESFYADPKSKKGGNRAAHTVAETKAVLKGVQGVLTSDQAPATSPRPQARN
jgi:muramidase (phage lysozyme)